MRRQGDANRKRADALARENGVLTARLEGAVEAARAVVRTAQAAFDDVDRGDHADLDPLRLAVRALDRATNGGR